MYWSRCLMYEMDGSVQVQSKYVAHVVVCMNNVKWSSSSASFHLEMKFRPTHGKIS